MGISEPPAAYASGQRIRLGDDTLWRKLDGEAVILQLGSGNYFGMNEVGAEALSIIREGVTLGALRAQLLERFEVDEATLHADLNELLADMSKRGLIIVE